MIRVAIAGYGNLGRGVEHAVAQNPDMTLVGVFTRRDPSTVKTVTGAPVFALSDVTAHKNDIDVMIVCGGSAKICMRAHAHTDGETVRAVMGLLEGQETRR